jgi:hypothetical protein
MNNKQTLNDVIANLLYEHIRVLQLENVIRKLSLNMRADMWQCETKHEEETMNVVIFSWKITI